jgi:hypothetical protein
MHLRNVGMALVRPRVALISLFAGALGACAGDSSSPPQLRYAPPEGQAAEPGPAAAGQPAGLVWNQLLDRLIQSSLQVDLADPERGIIVARYSGDPEPYVTCGWILVDRGGELEQVPASGQASFERVVQGRQLEVNRELDLDARLVVEVKHDGRGAAVETTSNYVLTKTVAAANQGGGTEGRAQEVISFGSGGRGEFSKGTVCQPNGALERTVLDVLPRATEAVPTEDAALAALGGPVAGSAPAARIEVTESHAPAGNMEATESSAPTADRQTADSAVPVPSMQSAESGIRASDRETIGSDVPGPAPQTGEAATGAPQATVAHAELPGPTVLEGPQQTGSALAFKCPIEDPTFCEVLNLTDPYRRANQERDLGLALEALEPGNPLLDGSGLGIDISLPKYDSYLTVSYFLKDGTVYHVLAGSTHRWPANAREFVPGLSVDARQSVEMVVALASDVPVFASPRPSSETAERFLSDLRERLSELRNGGTPAQIAASLLVITPA